MMAIEFAQKLGDGWRLEARKAGVVIGEITENEGRDADLERLKAAVQRLF